MLLEYVTRAIYRETCRVHFHLQLPVSTRKCHTESIWMRKPRTFQGMGLILLDPLFTYVGIYRHDITVALLT